METEEGPEKQYKLNLAGDGIKIEKVIPESIARQVVSLVMGGHQIGISTAPSSSQLHRKAPSIGGQLSLREFMDEAGAKRNPEKIVAIGAYLMETLNQETFTRKEVKLQFKNAGEPVPGNYTRDFDWAVSNAWLAPNQGGQKDYYVTKKGREAIENKFSDEIRKGTKLKPRRGKRRQQG
jgi:hypothetical protein